MKTIEGLHHITAVARDAQRNLDFYRNILGQRLVKKTVNFDDPTTYHLYYADYAGTPGSVITFFPWANTRRGARGNGTTNALAYNIAPEALGFWQEHLKKNDVAVEAVEKRFGADVLAFDDPDGMRIELVAETSQANLASWADGPVDPRFALQGFHSATLWQNKIEPTANVLVNQMGYTLAGQEGSRYRFTSGPNGYAGSIDIIHRPGGSPAAFGAGSIHHIAFRVPNDPIELEYQIALRAAGLNVSEVRDRNYFHSIYYREPGGVLFEIATNNPGFAVDEPFEALGEALKLPENYEVHRAEIESALVPLALKPAQRFEYASPK